MKKGTQSILTSKSENCTIKSKITDKFEETVSYEPESNALTDSFCCSHSETEPPRVLIISDNPLLQKTVSDNLSTLNAICEYVKTGEEAILKCNRLPSNHYSAVFIADPLPDTTMLHTAETLKGSLHISAPIIAGGSSTCNDPYVDAYISFPADDNDVSDVFCKALNGSLTISKEKALARLGHKQELYDKYYYRFRESYSNSAEKLRGLLDENKFDDAYRLAHSIKGLSGTLGLTDIYNISSRLSASLQSKETAVPHYIDVLEYHLNKLLP